jgi:Repeat of unknown function (DUF346)
MNHKRTLISVAMAATVLISLLAVVSSATSVSGTVMAGTGPAATSSGGIQAPAGYSGYADFFAVDSSGTLWHTPMNGNNTWDSLGGVCTASPAVVSWASSNFRQDVFVRGSNGALYHKYYQNGWSGWENLGGQLASGTGPAVSSWSAGRLDIFVEGTDGALWHKAWTGTSWSGWQSLGGKLTASPAATKDSHMIDVFVRGTDGAVWQKYWSGTAWSSWTSLGGRLAPNTGPAVSQTPWVIVQGTDSQFWQYAAGTYGAYWGSLGVAPPEALSASSPGAVSVPANMHTLVIFSSTSGNVWYGIHDVTGLISGWTSAGSPP